LTAFSKNPPISAALQTSLAQYTIHEKKNIELIKKYKES